jgi:hypothetical protein
MTSSSFSRKMRPRARAAMARLKTYSSNNGRSIGTRQARCGAPVVLLSFQKFLRASWSLGVWRGWDHCAWRGLGFIPAPRILFTVGVVQYL